MLFSTTVICILIQCPSLYAQGGQGNARGGYDGDTMYEQLSPGAFFSMNENVPPGMAPMPPGVPPGMGPMPPGAPPGMGPIPSDMGPMKPLPPGAQPGMGPMPPGAPPGIGPMPPGAPPGMGPIPSDMGPMEPLPPGAQPGMGPVPPGMGRMGPLTRAQPGMGPMPPDIGPMGPMPPGEPPGMGPMPSGMEPMGPLPPGMEPMPPDVPPGMGPMAPGMGKMEYGKKGYEHFDLSMLDNMALRQGNKIKRPGNFDENYAFPNIAPDDEELVIYNLCFCLNYIWRRGRESIRKYYHLRDIYISHMPFEIGYITHVIMSKYQNMLELYEYAAARVKPPATIKREILTHFQHSMLMDSQHVAHLCNMLHEIKAKYAVMEYNPENKFDIPKNNTLRHNKRLRHGNKHEAYKNGKENEKEDTRSVNKGYIAKKIEESHQLIDKAVAKKKQKLNEAREYYKKHGFYPTTTRTQQPMRLWSPNLDYGWSGEDEW